MGERKLRLLRNTDPPDLTPNVLMERAARGDEAAFASLYDELAPLVYGVALRVVRNPAMAEEIAQEAFVEMWRLAARFDTTRGSVTSWASTITHRKAVDRVRSEQARTDREDRDHTTTQPANEDAEAVSNVERAETTAEVRNALDSLTQAQREAVTLAFYGGYTYKEVAVLLNTPEGTIKTRIRDGLIKLRDQLGSTQ
jgi:RNA polymerase sigma-70 factor (ECF subfamily)